MLTKATLTATGILGAALLAGCSPVLHAQAGVTVDDQGRPVAIVRMCHAYKANDFLLFNLNDPSDSAVRRWKSRKPLGKTIRINLIGQADQSVWNAATGELFTLDPSVTYQFAGNEYNRDASIGRFNFTAKDVEGLTPHKVFLDSESYEDPKKPDIVSLAQFESYDCDD